MSTVYMTLFAESNSERRELPKKKTVIITGGNRGVGLAAAQILASSGKWNVVLACRSTERATAAKNSVQSGSDNIEVLQLDLSDLQSIKKFCKTVGDTKN